MGAQKIYAGAKLREIRTRLGLTQKSFAAKLGVSLPYLNQMENNNRPLSTAVVLALAQEFGQDVTELAVGDTTRLVSDLREALADPLFTDPPPMADLRLAASNAPGLVRAFLELHRAHRQSQERLAALDAVLGGSGAALPVSPWEEVRDFFHYCDNHIDALDQAAETLAGDDPIRAGMRVLDRHGVRLRNTSEPILRHYDPERRELTLSHLSDMPTRQFQILHQVALLTQRDLLAATLDLARFRTPEAREIARIGLANYFAGAALMPYRRFLEAAQDTRHDLERLASRFGASLEQVAHRLSTLQRQGARGVPFFFVRVDQAGTITKRHSAAPLQFARYGGGCPLWNVHRAFEQPGQFLRQLAETPDGARYILLARDVSKPGGAWGRPARRYAIALGCEIAHAGQLVYADGLDTETDTAFEPIGISCRICERGNCHQRSVPPVERRLQVDPDRRDIVPYSVA